MKKYSYILFLTLILLCLDDNFFSQQLINTDNNQELPIEIYADNGIEWHKNDKKYLALGNAKATRGSLSLSSDVIEAYYEESENSGMDIHLVKARKKVIVNDEKMRITGGNLAEYNIKKDYFSILGKNLLLTSEENRLKSNEKMEYWRSKDVAIATGKAIAIKKNEYIIKAEKLVWYLNKSEKKINVKKILGFQNVSIETKNEVAFSDKALYNRVSEICKLFGNVKLQKGESFLTGEYAEIDLKSGISKLLPAPGKNNLNENRVRALIDKEGVKKNESD